MLAPVSSESIWDRPEPGQRQPSMSRAQLTRTAIDIIDREGVAALSMRRLARELDSGTMSLYYYVRTEDELM